MCLGGGSKAPDPTASAQAQSAINKDALITAAQLNQINQTGPMGSISYSGEIGSPDRTQTTTLSPELLRLYNSQVGSSNTLSDLANSRLRNAPQGAFQLGQNPNGYVGGADFAQQSGNVDRGNALQNLFANGGDLSRSFDMGPDLATSFNKGPSFKTDVEADSITKGFDPAGQVQRNVNLSGQPSLSTDFGALTKQAQDADYAKSTQYLDPQFGQQEQALRSRLSAQGITEGSDAYNTELANFGRTRQSAYDDARNSAILSGNQQQQALFGQNLAARQQGVGEQFNLGNFSNQALAQQFGQNRDLAAFQNEAQSQGFGQNLDRANLYNQSAMNDFMRNQALAQFGNQAALDTYGRNRDYAQFGNDAAMQDYNRNLGAAQFFNQSSLDDFNRNLAAGQFSNDANARNLQQGLQLRDWNSNLYQQGLSNQILGRNQDINEAMAYLNGTPIAPQLPQYQGVAQSTAAQAAPDLIGLAASNYAAQRQARSGLLGSIFGGIGQVGAAAVCWVAREVYGLNDERWVEFRNWMLWSAPIWFRRIYVKYGPRIADWIKDKPRLKRMIRQWMDSKINAA